MCLPGSAGPHLQHAQGPHARPHCCVPWHPAPCHAVLGGREGEDSNLQHLEISSICFFYLLCGAGAPRYSGRAEDAVCGWTRVKHGVQIPEQAGPVPAPAASAPRPALCQTSSWETLNGSFQAFVFLAAVFLFSLPLSLSPPLGSSVYPPQLCRAPPRRPPAHWCQRDEKAEPRCSRCLPGLLGSAEMLNSKC